jgi:hypothetical protein
MVEDTKVYKERTSITISPSVLERSKKHCEAGGKKLSFSRLVEQALCTHLDLEDSKEQTP